MQHVVTIEKPASGQDGLGQPLPGYVTHATAWADIRHLSGLESIKAGAEASTVKASIRLLRYRTDITAAMRVVHGAKVYQVKAVLPDEVGRKFVDLQCEVQA